MAENGTATFASPDEYSAAIGAAKVNLFVTAGGGFKGRLTWLNLGGLNVLRGQENLPRIAFIALPPAQVHVSFPASGLSGLICCGLDLNLVTWFSMALASERISGQLDKGTGILCRCRQTNSLHAAKL
jgi:hypothetical protein